MAIFPIPAIHYWSSPNSGSNQNLFGKRYIAYKLLLHHDSQRNYHTQCLTVHCNRFLVDHGFHWDLHEAGLHYSQCSLHGTHKGMIKYYSFNTVCGIHVCMSLVLHCGTVHKNCIILCRYAHLFHDSSMKWFDKLYRFLFGIQYDSCRNGSKKFT